MAAGWLLMGLGAGLVLGSWLSRADGATMTRQDKLMAGCGLAWAIACIIGLVLR